MKRQCWDDTYTLRKRCPEITKAQKSLSIHSSEYFTIRPFHHEASNLGVCIEYETRGLVLGGLGRLLGESRRKSDSLVPESVYIDGSWSGVSQATEGVDSQGEK